MVHVAAAHAHSEHAHPEHAHPGHAHPGHGGAGSHLPGISDDRDASGHHRHDWHSPDYVADWIARDVTRDATRRALLTRMAALIPTHGQQPVQVLDVGGGYGAVSRAVLDTVPTASVVLHDYSAAMIEKAAEQLAGYGERVQFRRADLLDPSWTAEVGGPFDAVVSGLAIHNLAEPEHIARVYRDVYGLLQPGGCFFNVDLAFSTGPALAELYRRDPNRDPNRVVHIDRPGLVDHLRWLADAGFSEVDCIVKDQEQSLLCGIR
jgi:ubiquinone/menaquinone biosynthesis C-methylase UbiE